MILFPFILHCQPQKEDESSYQYTDDQDHGDDGYKTHLITFLYNQLFSRKPSSKTMPHCVITEALL